MAKKPGSIGIVGMGRSGEAVARLALRSGYAVRLLERKQEPPQKEKAEILKLLGMDVILGAHDPKMLEGLDQLVVSPGVSAAAEIVVWARQKGMEVIGEMEWSSRQFSGNIVAVTGTNGKTTTTALIAHLLNENGMSAVACGNIGTPLAQVILSDQIPQVAVAEISSFQLETIQDFHPKVSLFLNFTPDHLDRHASLEEYWLAKLRMYKNQGAGDWAVFHASLAQRLRPFLISKGISAAAFGLDSPAPDITLHQGEVVWTGKGPLFAQGDVPLIGRHNLENAAAASAAAYLCGLRYPAIGRALKTFHAVPHRLEPVGEVRGIRFINDSKATNVDSLFVALQSFQDKVVLIAGGRDKNQDFSSLRPLVQEKVKTVILIGEGADKMAKQWDGAGRILRAESLSEAVQDGFREAQPAGVVLLSPACASFDMFRDYEHRGKEFARHVEKLGSQMVSEMAV